MKLSPIKSANNKAGLPSGAAKGASFTKERCAPGTLVMYENDGTPILAVVIGAIKAKVPLLNERGGVLELPINRLHELPGSMPDNISTAPARTLWLADLKAKVVSQASAFPTSELWGFVSDEQREYTIEELCQLYYGKLELSPYIALRIALVGDKVFFKRREELFSPRSASVVEELNRAQVARQKKIQRRDNALLVFRERLKDPKVPFSEEAREFVTLLERIACEESNLEEGLRKEALDFLHLTIEHLSNFGLAAIQGNEAQKAFALLAAVGHFNASTNLALLRYRPRISFSAQLDEEAKLTPIYLKREELKLAHAHTRMDYTHVESFTIDDTSTRDMDDALSLERDGEGYKLGIHISDVAALLSIGSMIDEEARMRATSVYLPERTIHMLPDAFARERCSLVAGEIRPCLSCFFPVSRNFEIGPGVLVPTLIRSHAKLSYDEVDLRLERGDEPFSVLYNVAGTNEAARTARGAVKVNKRDFLPVVSDDGDVSLIEIDEDSPARALVGEMMVMINAFLAETARQERIPLIFRSQEAPEPKLMRSTQGIPEGPATDYAFRSQLKRSLTSATPAPHSSLGLPAYAQISSPIRRYADLVNQRQLLSYARSGAALYALSEIEQLITALDEPLGHANSLSKETKRFWLLKYLQKITADGTPLRATVLRTDMKTPLVEIESVSITALVRFPTPVKPGAQVLLRVTFIDPHFDTIKFEQIRE